MKKLSYLFVLILTVSLFQACQKDNGITDNTEPLVAPELPSEESFIMPFKNFEDADTVRGPFTNWFHAASNVVVWNTALALNLAIPVASFYASFSAEAEFQGDATWLWAYEYNIGADTYRAELYGKILSLEELQWEMYISKDGGFQNVLWYSGITATDRSYANWTLNRNAFNPTPYISSAYVLDNGNGEEVIRYTNITPNVPENGGYIEYRENDDAVNFDKAYDVYRAEIDNLLEINWNSLSNKGQVKDFEKFGDTDWHCWGSDLRDMKCD